MKSRNTNFPSNEEWAGKLLPDSPDILAILTRSFSDEQVGVQN